MLSLQQIGEKVFTSCQSIREFKENVPIILKDLPNMEKSNLRNLIRAVSKPLLNTGESPSARFYALYLLLKATEEVPSQDLFSEIMNAEDLMSFIFTSAQYDLETKSQLSKRGKTFFSKSPTTREANIGINFVRLCLEVIIYWGDFWSDRDDPLRLFWENKSILSQKMPFPPKYIFLLKSYQSEEDIASFDFAKDELPFRAKESRKLKRKTPEPLPTKGNEKANPLAKFKLVKADDKQEEPKSEQKELSFEQREQNPEPTPSQEKLPLSQNTIKHLSTFVSPKQEGKRQTFGELMAKAGVIGDASFGEVSSPVRDLWKKNAQKKGDKPDMDERVWKLETENDGLLKKNQFFQTEIKKHQLEILALQQKTFKVDEMEAENNFLKIEIEKYRQGARKANEATADLARENDDLRSVLADYEIETNKLLKENQRLRDTLSAKTKEMEDYRREIDITMEKFNYRMNVVPPIERPQSNLERPSQSLRPENLSERSTRSMNRLSASEDVGEESPVKDLKPTTVRNESPNTRFKENSGYGGTPSGSRNELPNPPYKENPAYGYRVVVSNESPNARLKEYPAYEVNPGGVKNESPDARLNRQGTGQKRGIFDKIQYDKPGMVLAPDNEEI